MRIVVKIGSSSLHSGIDPILKNFDCIASQIRKLRDSGHEVVLVSSGAIAFGRAHQKIDLNKQLSISKKQALASVGQVFLMKMWGDSLSKYRVTCGQVLVTNEVLGSSATDQKSHLLDTFRELFSMGILPIINENDAVAVAEIVQGDNDKLSALIANMINAQELYLLGTASAVFKNYPDETTKIKQIDLKDTPMLKKISHGTNDSQATGGMVTKIEAAQIFLRDNNAKNKKTVYIASGSSPNSIELSKRGDIGTKITNI